MDLAGVPNQQRESLVAMTVSRAAPFPDPSYEVAWQGSRAAVWYWPAARMTALAGGLGRRDRVVAESPRLGQPRDGGAELLALDNGLEGRLWREGALLASRWWSSSPSGAEWASFVRGAGFDPSTLTMPQPAPAVRYQAAWQSRDRAGLKRLAEDAGAFVPQAMRYAAYAVVTAFCWHLGGALHARWGLHAAQAEMAALTDSLEPILDARSRADADRAAVDELLALRAPAPQLSVLAEASRLMEGSGWRVLQWSQPNEDTVEVRFRESAMDGEAVVSTWEASPWFESVTPSLDPQGTAMTLQARLTPTRDRLAEQQPSDPGA